MTVSKFYSFLWKFGITKFFYLILQIPFTMATPTRRAHVTLLQIFLKCFATYRKQCLFLHLDSFLSEQHFITVQHLILIFHLADNSAHFVAEATNSTNSRDSGVL